MQQTLESLPPVVFLGSFLALWLWEGFAGARRPARGPARKARNLALTAVNVGVSIAAGTVLVAASLWIAQRDWGLAGVDWPPWSTVLLGVLALDLTDYLRHRLTHNVPLLWRLHRVHHTDPQIDVTSSLRSHPLEQALRPLFEVTTIVLVGIAPLTLAVHALVQIATVLFQHANITLPLALDRAIAWITPTPAYHLVHHSRRQPQTDSNYGASLTLWDRLFGTLQPSDPRAHLGLDGFDAPRDQSLAGLLANPWRTPAETGAPAR